MGKKWFLIVFVLLLVTMPLPAHSYLSESEMNELEKCPLKTYVQVIGEGIYNIACKSITIEQGYTEVYLNTSCDEGKDNIIPYVNLDKGKYGGEVRKERELWKLHSFRLKDNPFLLKCIKNKTSLKNQEIWVNIIASFEIENVETQKGIKKELERITNNTGEQSNKTKEIINKSGEILKGINEINITTKKINTTLTEEGEEKDCKKNFGIITIILGLILTAIFAYFGSINKRNKKLRRLYRTLAITTIFLIIIIEISMRYFICK